MIDPKKAVLNHRARGEKTEFSVFSVVRKIGSNNSMQINFKGQYDRDLFFKAVVNFPNFSYLISIN